MARKYRKWSSADQRKLEKLMQQGLSAYAIAKALKRSTPVIRSKQRGVQIPAHTSAVKADAEDQKMNYEQWAIKLIKKYTEETEAAYIMLGKLYFNKLVNPNVDA